MNIKEEISNNKFVILYIWKDMCPGCRVMSPIIDELTKTNSTVKIIKVDAMDNLDLVREYNLTTAPTILFLNNGVLVDKIIGVERKINIEAKISNLFKE